MNQKHRLMCESWVEKRPEVSQVTAYGTPSTKQGIKWKTRYAMLVVSPETRMSEIRFYQKKPRSCTEITDDIIKLQPWQYIVDIPSWIVDKGRPHVLRLRLIPESVIPGQHYRLQIAYQSSEEATAWMRCIQNQTKLTSGIQGHSFGVVAEECSATARIGIAGKHCLLFVSPIQVILAHKTDRSVVCVWPFETIRSYATDDDRRLVVEAGRCAPLGEGVYSFRTRENDDNVLFDLFDHYTTTATVEPPKSKLKSKDSRGESTLPDQTKSAPTSTSQRQSTGKSRKQQKPASRADSDTIPLISSTSSGTLETDEPPEKPPLPENRKVTSKTPTKDVSHSPKSNRNFSNNKEQEGKVRADLKRAKKDEQNGDTLSRGMHDLDKLLYSLEDSVRASQENIAESSCAGYDLPSQYAKSVNESNAEVVASSKSSCHGELAYAVNAIKMDGDKLSKDEKIAAMSHGEVGKKSTKSKLPYTKVDMSKKCLA